MVLYFYFNETTGNLVYSDRADYSGIDYWNLGQQTNTNPSSSNKWVFDPQRASIKTVTKDPHISKRINILTSMNGMFYGCMALTSLDLSGFDTSNVTNMEGLFDNCIALTSLDLSGFDTSNVTNMNGIFNGCRGLTSLDLSGFNTSNVTNMYSMFYGCTALTSLDLSSFDTSNVTGVSDMFHNCPALRIIDISPNMSNILSQLPAATYYDAATRQSYAKADIPGGGTYVRDLADLDLVSTMVQNRQAVRSVRHMVNGLSKRVVALETSVASLKQ